MLATKERCIRRIRENWPIFQKRRHDRLSSEAWIGSAAEKVAESILEDLFTQVLDWQVGEMIPQVDYADLVLSRMGIKHLIIEVKRPGSLAWNEQAVAAALDQACRYAAEQKVRTVAVSDGHMFYAANIENGGLRDRIFVPLEHLEPQEALWWVSVDGIYRPNADPAIQSGLLPKVTSDKDETPLGDRLLHPKYKLPASCFGYVDDPNDVRTWKLPHRLIDGSVDLKRLPKAIQCILTNYRGAHVDGIPYTAIPDVLERLGRAAASVGKMPFQKAGTADVYVKLEAALNQVGRLTRVENHQELIKSKSEANRKQ